VRSRASSPASRKGFIGTRIQPEDVIRVAVESCQHDHWRVNAFSPQQTADITRVHVGQADIQQDRIVIVLYGASEGGGACSGLLDIEFLMKPQLFRQRVAEIRVVFDY
jgi:hypothetical protein